MNFSWTAEQQQLRQAITDIALTLAAESLGIDSERYLFKQLPDELIWDE